MTSSRKKSLRKKIRPTKSSSLAFRKMPADPVTSARLSFAVQALNDSGKLIGARTSRLSARVDPGLVKAARQKTGLECDADLVNAALAMIAALYDFGPWFATQAGRLPKDFELDL
jgi:hypothetical protein